MADACDRAAILFRAQWRRPYRAGSQRYFSAPVQNCPRFCGPLSRRELVNVFRCVNCIASDACRIFLRFSKGSTKIWMGGAAFRHDNSPSRVGALADKVPAGHSFQVLHGLRTCLRSARNPWRGSGFLYMANKHDSELTPQQVKQNGLGRRGAPVREQRPASRRPRGRYTLRQNIRVLDRWPPDRA